MEGQIHDIAYQIWPYYTSLYARELLSRWGNLVHLHEVDMGQQSLGAIIRLELYMMQIVPSKMFKQMRPLFIKWYKSPNRAEREDASTIAYYTGQNLHNYFFASGIYNYNICRNDERFSSLYFLYTRQFAYQDFGMSTVKVLCEMANVGISDQEFIDMMRACIASGNCNVPFVWEVYKNNLHKQQLISQHQQNDIARLNTQVISNPVSQESNKNLASSDDLQELWELANTDDN